MVPDYPKMAEAYAEVIASGRLPSNRLLVKAAKRYLRMLKLAKDPRNDFIYSPIHVIDYCSFAEKLKHFEGGNWEVTQRNDDGTVNRHIILEPWQIWVESAIQGFRWRYTGSRVVTTALELVPRKNAKSLKAVTAALFDLCCSGTLNPEIPIAAATAKQADDTLFGDIVKMVNADDELREQYKLVVTKDTIKKGDGRIFKLSSLADHLDGLNPSLAIFEEGHAGDAAVYKVVSSSFGSRQNQLKRMITTAGQQSEGPGHELLLQAQMVLNDDSDTWTFFAAIWTLDREDYLDKETNAIDWMKLLTDESLIQKANPMYGIGLDPIAIREAVREGIKFRIDLRGEIARTRFNIWTGAGTTLFDETQWAACKRKISLDDFVGWKCWIGVDLAQVLDMCAIALLFEMPGGELVVFTKYYLPEASPTASLPDLVDSIQTWHDAGHLVLTPGQLADHDLVREEVELFCEVFDVQTIACDPAQAHNTVKKLWDGSKPVMTYPNSAATMTAPTDDLLGRAATQQIWHDGNPMLAWNVRNVYGERKGNGSIMPRKETPGSPRKIDGFVALCFADGVRMQPEMAKDTNEHKSQDPYLTRGIIGFEKMVAGNGR